MEGGAPSAERSALARWVAWFSRPDDKRYAGLEDDLIRTTGGGVPVVVFGCVCLLLQVGLYAFVQPLASLPLALSGVLAAGGRMLGMRAARSGLAAAPMVVGTGLVWAAVVGLACALGILTGHIVLTTVCALTVTGFAFTSVYNNAGMPRLARVQVAIVAVPFLVASAFTGVPGMEVLFVLGPIWMIGVMHLTGRSHDAVATLVLTRNQNRFLASNDELTGIANRAGILDAIETLSRKAGGAGEALPFLLYLDLDGFKGVNDGFGHACGDHVLKVLAGRFVEDLGEAGCIGRVGGDEFVIVLPGGSHAGAAELAERLIARAREPVVLPGGSSVRVGVTIGGASVLPGRTDEALALADARLYDGKRRGGGVCLA